LSGVEEVEGHANYEMGLMRLHLDERIHHRMQWNIMSLRRERKEGCKNSEDSQQQ
jgi:hypothetical protein